MTAFRCFLGPRLPVVSLFLWLASWGLSVRVWARDPNPVSPPKIRVVEIVLHGLTKTDPQVVLTELDVQIPEEMTYEDLENAIQRVWNLNLFVKVNYELTPLEGRGGSRLDIQLQDRWTTIPILKFGGGGGVQFYTLGVYDPNVMGRYLELGSQYENLGGQASFVGWWRRPQLFGNRRARFGGDVWNTTRNRMSYDSERNEIGGFTVARRRFNVFYDHFVTDFFRPGLAVDVQTDTVGESGLSSRSRKLNAERGEVPGGRENFTFLRLYSTFGRQDLREELVTGVSYQPSAQFQLNESGERDRLLVLRQELLWATALDHRHNLAFRLAQGHHSRPSRGQDTYLGGLGEIRGFLDSQFRVRNYAFQNLEYRWPWRYSTKFTLQQVFFYDAGWMDGDLGIRMVHAVGSGFRFVFPGFYRLNLRLDYGVSIGDLPGQNVSFGLQQFF